MLLQPKRISVLEKSVAELIAAGEVVDRPASVVKELLENAMDSGASTIVTEIKNGGITYIRVTDNGCGIFPEDLPKAFLRHATSKVRQQEDLQKIHTFGFRGEALAAISAVAKVEITSRTPEALAASCYRIAGGEEQGMEQTGAPAGTSVVVSDLFFNTPARMKFMKKDTTEGAAISAVVEKLAIAHPEVSFKLISNGSVRLLTPGSGDHLAVIYAVFGKEFAKSLIPVSYEGDGVRAEGFLSKPMSARSNRSMQHFYVNGRYVKSKTCASALEEGMKGSLMVGKYPACVLRITLAPQLVDVNVHPAKIEVKFSQEREVYQAVYFAVKSALQKEKIEPEITFSSKTQAQHISAQQYQQLYGKESAVLPDRISLKNPQSGRRPSKPESEPPEENLYNIALKSSAVQAEAPKTKPEEAPREPTAASEQTVLDKTLTLHSGTALENYQITLTERGRQFLARAAQNAAKGKETEPDFHENHTKFEQNQAKLKQNEAVFEGKFSPTSSPQDNNVALEHSGPLPSQTGAYLGEDEVQTASNTDILSSEQLPLEPGRYQNIRMVGELFDTYILLEHKDQMLLIDKHAAHERLIYEQLKQNITRQDRQMLMTPVPLTANSEEAAALLENQPLLEQLGFSVEGFGFNTVLIREVPMVLGQGDIREILLDIAQQILKKRRQVLPEQLDDLLHSVACRAAVKAHNKNHQLELEEIIRLLNEHEEVRFCPHGRPIAIVMQRREIEKQFGRI